MDNPDLSTRMCLNCKEKKPNNEFHLAKTGINGRSSLCKSCRKTKSSSKYQKDWFVFQHRLRKSACKKRGIAYDLSPEYLKSIWTGVCPVTGKELSRGKKSDNSAALDKIDPSKGYVQGNVCYISARANRIKYDASIEELRQILDWCERATAISKESTPK